MIYAYPIGWLGKEPLLQGAFYSSRFGSEELYGDYNMH